MSDATLPRLSNQPPAEHLEQALLPWEDATVFRSFHQGFLDEHNPIGPTEAALVETISWGEWRRRRIRLAERAVHLERAYSVTGQDDFDSLTRRALVTIEAGRPKLSSKQALETDADFDTAMTDSCAEDEAMTSAAVERLEAGGPDAYEQALAMLRQDSRDWWQQELEDTPARYSEDADGLRRFIDRQIVPWFSMEGSKSLHRPAVRLQAWGESLSVRTMSQLHLLDERLQRTIGRAIQQLQSLQARREKRAKPFRPLG